MANASKLTLAFVNKRPLSAARVLESLPTDDAAAFIETLPTRYAVKVLLPLNASHCASILQRLNVSTTAAVLREMEFLSAAAVLRQVPETKQLEILDELPDQSRREFESAMSYPPDTVGAWMNPTVVTASHDETVAIALNRVKEDRDGHTDAVFVVDAQRKLLGSVHFSVLVRKDTRTVLSALMDTTCPPVSARTRIAQFAISSQWHDLNERPVVSRRGELIGVLFRKSVLNRTPGEAHAAEDVPSITGSLLQMLTQTAPGIVDLFAPSAIRRAEPGDSHER